MREDVAPAWPAGCVAAPVRGARTSVELARPPWGAAAAARDREPPPVDLTMRAGCREVAATLGATSVTCAP